MISPADYSAIKLNLVCYAVTAHSITEIYAKNEDKVGREEALQSNRSGLLKREKAYQAHIMTSEIEETETQFAPRDTFVAPANEKNIRILLAGN